MISRLLRTLATKEYRSSKCQTKSGGSIQGDQKAIYTACRQHSQKEERRRNHWTAWAKRTAVSAHTAAAREARVAKGKNGFCLIMSCQRGESHVDTTRAVRRWNGTGQLVGRRWNGTRQLVVRRWDGTRQQDLWGDEMGHTNKSYKAAEWDTPTRVVRRQNRTHQQELWGGGMGHARRAMRWLHGAGAPQVGNDQGWHQIGWKTYGSGGGGYVYGGRGIRQIGYIQIGDMESDKIMVIWCCKYSPDVWQELWL